MPTPVRSSDNLHTLAVYGQPLGLECGCGRRGLVAIDRLGARKGSMRLLSSLRFVCSRCGSRAWRGFLFVSREEAQAFLEGPTLRGQPSF